MDGAVKDGGADGRAVMFVDDDGTIEADGVAETNNRDGGRGRGTPLINSAREGAWLVLVAPCFIKTYEARYICTYGII